MFREVTPEEFYNLEGPRPEYLKICGYLSDIAGGQWEGVSFKDAIIEKFGWPDSGRPFNHAPELAAEVFNEIAKEIAVFEAEYNRGFNKLFLKLKRKSKLMAFEEHVFS